MMTTVIALVPIVSLIFFLVVLEKPAFKAASISLLITLVTIIFYWRMDSNWISASLIKGVLLASEIMFILIGVFLMVAVMKKGRAFSFIGTFAFKITKDVRAQAILLAWFSVAFIEGIAGFGTPSMIIAPLMVSLGFSPLAAVVATLVGDGMAVTFGAAGVPMTVGIAQGVGANQAIALGTDFVSQVSISTALFHFMLGIFLPFVIICLISLIHTKSFTRALSFWKFALASGFIFAVPYLAVALLLGPEFPTIIGSTLGGILVALLARYKVFFPKDEWVFHDAHAKIRSELSGIHHRPIYYAKALLPYAIVVTLLLVTRTDFLSAGEFLSSIIIPFNQILGTSINYRFVPLNSPGFFFVVAAIAGLILYKMRLREVLSITKNVAGKVVKIFIALAGVLAIVQLMIYSSHNTVGLPSISIYLASILSNTGPFWPIFSPLVGLMGAFIAGSSTVSNLMFASMQVEAATAIGISPILGLALQSIGSAVGNMVAVHNVVAASAVVHLEHAEGKVIKYNFFPALLYALAAGIIGMIIVWLI